MGLVLPFSNLSLGGIRLSSSARSWSSSDSRRPSLDASKRHRVATNRCPPFSSSNRVKTCSIKLYQKLIKTVIYDSVNYDKTLRLLFF